MDDSTSGTAPEPARPVLRVVRGAGEGGLTVELAALVAVLGARGGAEPEAPVRPNAWSDPRNRLRQPVYPGPGGWRISGLPR